MNNLEFPSFDAGTPGTLLDSENAKKVKRFIEGFNRLVVSIGDKTTVTLRDSDLEIQISKHVLNKAFADYITATYQIKTLSVCDGGTPSSLDFVIVKPPS